MPRTRRYWKLWFGLGLALVVVVAWRSFRPVPSYNGRTAQQWTAMLCGDRPQGVANLRSAELWLNVDAVLERIGEPAVPYLVTAANQRETLYAKIHKRLPDPIAKRLQEPYDYPNREYAFRVLAAIKPHGRLAVQAMVRGARDADDRIRYRALTALREVSAAEFPMIVDVASERLYDDDFAVRVAACRALMAMGPDAREAVPALVERLSFKPQVGRDDWPMALALGHIGVATDETVSLTKELMDAEDPILRAHATDAYWRLTADHATAVKAYQALLKEEVTPFRILQLLSHMGKAGAAALQVARDYMEDVDYLKTAFPFYEAPYQLTNVYAAECVWKLSGDPSDALPVFAVALELGEDHVQYATISILESMGAEAAPLERSLCNALNANRREPLLLSGIRILGSFDALSLEAQALLRDLRSHDRLRVRDAAANALGEIAPGTLDAEFK